MSSVFKKPFYGTKDFFKRLCVVDSKFRYTAEEALTHPWITRRFEDPIPLNYQDYLYQESLKKIMVNVAQVFVYLSRFPGAENVINKEV